MFLIPEKAIFLIKNGNEIFVSPISDLHDKHLRLYILGTCMGAILMQRKVLPLHGSAIAIDGTAYAIVGESGAGKTTLSFGFFKQEDFNFLVMMSFQFQYHQDNIPIVTPAYPQQKLWIESLDKFGMNSNEYEPIVERETKFTVPVLDQFINHPLTTWLEFLN